MLAGREDKQKEKSGRGGRNKKRRGRSPRYTTSSGERKKERKKGKKEGRKRYIEVEKGKSLEAKGRWDNLRKAAEKQAKKRLNIYKK